MPLKNNDFELLLQQTKLNLQSENWGEINACWQGFLEDPNQLEKLSPAQRQELGAIAFHLLTVEDFQTRWDLVKWFPKLGEDCLTILLSILQNSKTTSEARWFSVKMLGEFPKPEVILSLVELLNDSSEPDVKAIAAQSLSKIGLPAINTLAQLLTIESTRFNATQALVQIPNSQVIDPLLTVVDDANSQIRAMAIAALSQFSEARIFSVLKTALTDLNASVRKETVMAIGSHSEFGPERLALLKPLLFDLNLEVCQQTAIALSRCQSPEAAQALGKLVQSSLTPLPLQIQAIQALGWLEYSESVSYLGQILNDYSFDSAVYREILKVMGRYRDQSRQSEALQWLLIFWQSEHPALQNALIRQTLAQCLGQFSDSRAIPILQSLGTDPENTVRLQAIASLKKLVKLSEN